MPKTDKKTPATQWLYEYIEAQLPSWVSRAFPDDPKLAINSSDQSPEQLAMRQLSKRLVAENMQIYLMDNAYFFEQLGFYKLLPEAMAVSLQTSPSPLGLNCLSTIERCLFTVYLLDIYDFPPAPKGDCFVEALLDKVSLKKAQIDTHTQSEKATHQALLLLSETMITLPFTLALNSELADCAKESDNPLLIAVIKDMQTFALVNPLAKDYQTLKSLADTLTQSTQPMSASVLNTLVKDDN